MLTSSYLRYAAIKTALGVQVLRVRLSVRETQTQFAERFRVSKTTVHKWERGQTVKMHRLYKEILDNMTAKLMKEGRLVPEEMVDILFRGDRDGLGRDGTV